MRELTESHNIVIFIDELHTLVGRRVGRGQPGRGQHPEARALPRRDPVHRRHHARRVPQVHREGPLAGAALPGGEGGVARPRRRRSRSCAGSRTATRSSTTSPTRTRRWRRPSTSRAATSPTASCPDKAIDLLDEAGSRVKLRDAAAAEEQPEFRARIRVVVERGEGAPRLLPRRGGRPSARTCRSCASTGTSRAAARTRSPRPTSTTWSRSGPASPSPRSRRRSPRSSCAWRRSCTSASSRRRARSARWRAPSGARGRAQEPAPARWARSCSWARPASARPRSRAAWPRSCSAPSAP